MSPGLSPKLLRGARVYLSGPMDFVASRANEMKFGWRNRVGEFLRAMGAVVFDPWAKPEVRGLHDYGREGIDSTAIKDRWTFEQTGAAAEARAAVTGKFWETLHIDLRMVDTSDFIVAYCPTNIYSVGTPHEIALARAQRKPVLLVSPPIIYPALTQLREHMRSDAAGAAMLDRFLSESGIRENPGGVPSLWYTTLVGGHGFFDGFGFAPYRRRFRWARVALDDQEEARALKNPLLPFLARLNQRIPKRWDNRAKKFVRNDDWLLWDLRKKGRGGSVEGPASPPARARRPR